MTTNDELQGRHILVTGASRGLGRAAAVHLAGRGAVVTLAARDRDELEEVREEIGAAGGVAHVHAVDATDPAAVEALAAAAEETAPLWGCLHAVGGNRTGPSAAYAPDDLEWMLALNVRSAFVVLQAVARRLLARADGGRLVVLTSQMGSVGYPGRAAYCASKHAVNGMAKAFAVEWAPAGVTVNALAPTFVDTPMTRPMLADPEFRADVLRRIPAGRLGETEEVAAAAAFLLSPSASLITGAVVPIDGGWTAW